MDIYLKNLKTKDKFRFPMLPEEITVSIGNEFASYSIIRLGEVRIPAGTSLNTVTWKGKFPGKARKGDPYIKKWKKPKACYKWINGLKAKGGKPIKARLTITGTPINFDVYLDSWKATPTGGYGDIDYTITLIQARKIKIKKAGGAGKGSFSSGDSETESTGAIKDEPATEERVSGAAVQTYTTASGDTLWKIAQLLYGNGSEYPALYEANKSAIGSDPSALLAGLVLTIPS